MESAMLLRILSCGFGTALVLFLSKIWIKKLYAECDPAILSYPDAAKKMPRLRPLLLGFSAFVSFFLLSVSSDPIFLARGSICIFFLQLYCVTDFEQQVIFDKTLAPFALLALPFSLALGLDPQDLALAAIGGGVVFFALVLITRCAIGMGDAKLIAVLGLWLGTENLITVCVCGFILAGAISLLLLLLRLKGRKDYIAYGPWFAVPALFFLI